MAARGETQADVEVSTLVVPAWRLRWQAPEIALVLGERALALATARHDEADRLKAEALVVFASNRIGRGVRIAERALDALKAAEAAGEHQTAWLLRIELAGCARSVGAPLTGFAAVRPVLEAEGVPYALRAAALVEASECIVTVGRGDEPAHALEEADRLYAADTVLDGDTKYLLRGLLRAVSAAQFRRWGDIPAAISSAEEGLRLLDQAKPSTDSGQAMGRLTLELVCALMDANKFADASQAGTPLLDQPVRAPSASTAGWLRLALATRVHLPAGRVTQAREMLRDAAASAERHQLDTLLAESLLALAHVHEVSGELADALINLRTAHAAERRRARAVYSVRARLAAEFSGVHRQPSSLHQQLADLLSTDGGPPRPPAPDATVPPDLKQQLRQWRPVQVRKGEGPLKVKRVRRAAEDMTVEGLSAARAHAADRWRMVQPFGDPEDKAPDPVDQQQSDRPSSDRTVPAAGLIASAGAMISGRRRAAREAAGEVEPAEPSPFATPALEPEPAFPKTAPAPEPTVFSVPEPETPQPEPAPEPLAQPQPAPAQSESVLDMLKAAGLRQGGRRRAPDPEDEEASSESQQWRVEPPARLRSQPEPEQPDQLPRDFFDSSTAVPPTVGPDALPARPPRSSLTSAFGQEPAEPHIDLPAADPQRPRGFGLAAAFGQHQTETPASTFGEPEARIPAPQPERETDPEPDPFPQRPTTPQHPVPDEVPDTPTPDEIPPVPTPDEVPRPPNPDDVPTTPAPEEKPEPDLMSTTFLSPADVDGEHPAWPDPHPSDAFPQLSLPPDTNAPHGFEPPVFEPRSPEPVEPPVDEVAAPSLSEPEPVEELAVRPDSVQFVRIDPELMKPAPSADTSQPVMPDFSFGPPKRETPPAADTAPEVAQPVPTEAPAASEDAKENGLPSARRKASDMSLAELLAEALVAYETGRRDEEIEDDWDPASAENGTAQQTPEPTADPTPQPETFEPPAAQPETPVSFFGQPTSQPETSAPSFGQSTQPETPAPSFGQPAPQPESPAPSFEQPTAQPETSAPSFAQPTKPSFGQPFVPSFAQQPYAPTFGQPSVPSFAQQPYAQPTQPAAQFGQQPAAQAAAAQSDASNPAETTGPIKPVEQPNTDNETTGPIRRVEESPFGGWTLPGS